MHSLVKILPLSATKLFNAVRLSRISHERTIHSGSLVEFLSREFFHPGYVHMKFLSNLLISTHTTLSLPWDTTIVCTAVLLRSLITFPFYVYSERNYAKVAHVAIDCSKSRPLLEQKVKHSLHYKRLTESAAKAYMTRMSRTVFIRTCEANHCHPAKSAAVTLVQIPLWFSFTYTLRNICGFHTTSGYGWPPIMPDIVSEGINMTCTSCVIPVGLLLTGLANVELTHLRRPRSRGDGSVFGAVSSDHWSYRVARGFGWFGNLCIFGFSFLVPKALVIYWLTSAIHQLFTHLLVMHPTVRHWFGIWPRPNEGNQPYKVVVQAALSRYRILRWLRSKFFV
ncbi:Cytochrome c oxidase assembly protein cox18, mitochondrial [Clonorchis sinensis]|uniref:Cytochrome c oxidase assembly protein cox18, mitochondrial n=1 Tax=Clonorchis sinensis TaxID=79923 RepID=A0A8T1M0Q1_CLOSI|nr:Cytochrome c oxidase assembly protein cox18, mitochondrial [Clonorchis sinensis]